MKVRTYCNIALFSINALGAGYACSVLDKKPREIFRDHEVRIEVPATEKPFEEYLRQAARAQGVPETIAFAVDYQESRGEMDAIRFEPAQMERAKKATGASGEQLRMYSSSHCALQVMGYNAARYKHTWADLHRPEICAEVGMAILANCMERTKGKDPVKRMFGALACYNGSDEYARVVLNRLGTKLLQQHLEKELG